jgi:hypothetical protein
LKEPSWLITCLGSSSHAGLQLFEFLRKKPFVVYTRKAYYSDGPPLVFEPISFVYLLGTVEATTVTLSNHGRPLAGLPYWIIIEKNVC